MSDNIQEREIIRKSFGLKKDILPQLEASYDSPLIDKIKSQDYELIAGRLKIKLAREFGFCYGVDRAIEYAYETRTKFPDKRIFLTNEIIHNPQVNSKLSELGIKFLTKTANSLNMEDVGPEDVVLIPAFGNPTLELKKLQARGCILVDTTCGSVMSVWKRVESYSRDGFTAAIHGKYDHEETLATSSRANKYVVIRDRRQTDIICGYIEGRVKSEEFFAEFKNALSDNFDPALDLGYLGCANQTTMLSSESMEIASLLRESMIRRHGEQETANRFRHFDTICSATQDRQDAVLRLVREGIDLMIVVGGYNSSNTGHLVEISLESCPAYHVKDAGCILSKDLIQHKKVMSHEIIDSTNWLPEGPAVIGVTAGASTPNRVIQEVIERILDVGGCSGEKRI